MTEQEGCWKAMDDVVVPDDSPVADRAYWQVAGTLIALALLGGDGIHPVSPAVVYALLSNVEERSDPRAPMDLSLEFIDGLQKSKASILLPWMIIPPGQDWRALPTGHQTLVRDLINGLGIEVSGRYLSVFVANSDVDPSATESAHGPENGPHSMDNSHHHLRDVWKPQLPLHNTIHGDVEGLPKMLPRPRPLARGKLSGVTK